MKLNSIALLAAIAMLNVTPTVVFAQNGGNNTGPAASSSDTGTTPSIETSNAPTGQTGSEMLPLQQEGTGSATGDQGEGGTIDSGSGNGGSNSNPSSGSSSY
jgi:hypothetical protein